MTARRSRFGPAGMLLALAAVPVLAGQAPAPGPTSEEEATLQRADAYFHLMQAEMALQDERLSEVVREIRAAAALEPTSARLRAEAAGLLLQAGQRLEAERFANRALELDPGNTPALQVLADIAASRATEPGADPEAGAEAVRLYEKLAASPNVDDEVLLMLSQLKLRQGDAAGAVDVAARLVAQRPGDPLVVRLLAQALVVGGDPARALRTVLDFLTTNPVSEDLLVMAERLAQQTGEWEPLEKACAAMAAEQPDLAPVRRVRGEALLTLDRPREAVAELERAVALNSDGPSVRLDLAHAYLLANRLADAAALASELAHDYPGNLRTLLILGEAREGQRDLDGAVESFTEALQTLTSSPSTEAEQRDRWRLRIAEVLAAAGRNDEALDMLGSLEVPDKPEAATIEARVAIEAGDLKRARNLARALRPEHAGEAALIEGDVLLHDGQLSKAMARFDEAIGKTGDAGRRWAAELLRRADHPEQEEHIVRAWTEAEPDSAAARYALGSLLDRTGRFEESETQFRRALEIRPDYAEAMNYLGYSLADRNVRLPEALDLIRRALEVDPWNGAYLDSLGWVYYRQGRFAEAREPLERAAREFPRDPVVLEHLGDLYDRLGEPEAARRVWRKALDAGAENPDILRQKLEHASRRRDGTQANSQPSGPAGG